MSFKLVEADKTGMIILFVPGGLTSVSLKYERQLIFDKIVIISSLFCYFLYWT